MINCNDTIDWNLSAINSVLFEISLVKINAIKH